MTKQQILTKAIQKAMERGFDLEKCAKDMGLEGFLKGSPYQRFLKPPLWWPKELLTANTYAVIFNHDFAKALWGEEAVYDDEHAVIGKDGNTDASYTTRGDDGAGLDGDYEYRQLSAWQYHLQQMVIADDPIEYLGGHLPE